MKQIYKDYLIRDWEERDRIPASNLIQQVLEEYGLPWQPAEADRDVIGSSDILGKTVYFLTKLETVGYSADKI